MKNLVSFITAAALIGVSSPQVLAHGDEDEHHSANSYSRSVPQTYPGSPGYPAANQNLGGFGAYTGYWNQNQQQHEVLKRAGQQLDQLQAQGLVSPQEHAMLEAQMQLDHAAYDGQPLPSGFGYTASDPYVNPAVQGVLQRLANTWGMVPPGSSAGVFPPAQSGGFRHTMQDALSGNTYGHSHQGGMAGLGASAPFGNYVNYWNKNPQQHQVLRRSEQEAHELLRQGIITPQEHAILDAQWQADHAAYDGRQLPQNFNYGFQSPYVNPSVPGILQKLGAYWKF